MNEFVVALSEHSIILHDLVEKRILFVFSFA